MSETIYSYCLLSVGFVSLVSLLFLLTLKHLTKSIYIIYSALIILASIFLLRGFINFDLQQALQYRITPKYLFAAGFLAIIIPMLIPLEIIQSQRLSWPNILALGTYLTYGLVYFMVTNHGATSTYYPDLATLLQHLSAFESWGRLIFPGIALLFCFSIIVLHLRELRLFINYLRNNLPEGNERSILYISFSIFSPALICTGWLFNLYFANSFMMILFTIIFDALILINTNALLKKSPYLEWADFLRYMEEQEGNPLKNEINEEETKAEERSPYGLLVQDIETWFKVEKPYLNPNFQQLDVMNKLQINRAKSSNIFKYGFGVSFVDFVNLKRIDYAIELMSKDTDMTLSQIAYEIGYSSPSVFTRTFIKYKGCTPSEFRKEKLE